MYDADSKKTIEMNDTMIDVFSLCSHLIQNGIDMNQILV